METLEEVKLNLVYQIERIQTSDSVKKHLQNLGVIIGSKIVVINRSGSNSILLLKNNRIAVNRELLSQIIVKKASSPKKVGLRLTSLLQAKVVWWLPFMGRVQ